MAIDFDGVNLIITLDSGVTEVDVREDLYEGWKDWLLSNNSNLRFPRAFRPVGGDELTSVINAGSYFFLNNVAGWRLRPPEENITIFLTGNIAVEDVTVGTVLPTIGNFTTAIFGLQPVTQGVVPEMRANLAFSTYQGGVCINAVNGNSGVGQVGTDQIGTRRAPSNNTDDVLTILVREGLHRIFVAVDLDTDTQIPATPNTNFSAGYAFIGDSPFINFTLGTGVNMTNCSLDNFTLNGELDGVNNLIKCRVGTITNMSGQIQSCDLIGDININGDLIIEHSYSGKEGLLYPRVLGIGSDTLIVRDMRGSLGVGGVTGGTHTIGVYGGRIVIEASCSGGTLYLRGDPYEVLDLSGGAVTLVDQTGSLKLDLIYKSADLDINPTGKLATVGKLISLQ